jgi:ADP-ribose pyrophosphatase YjhB (NUDIX family)
MVLVRMTITLANVTTFWLKAAVAVDLVVLTIRDDELVVLLVRRGSSDDTSALPGGFVRTDEDLEDAAGRELADETGVAATRAHLEQLATYGSPGRDPRGRIVTVAYLAVLPGSVAPPIGLEAAAAAWAPVRRLSSGRTRLAFDHERILADGLERARAKLENSPLATAFCSAEFTIAELRRVYEIVWDTVLDPRNFHRKISSTSGFVVETGRTTMRNGGRPARLYRRGRTTSLHPPMLRPV